MQVVLNYKQKGKNGLHRVTQMPEQVRQKKKKPYGSGREGVASSALTQLHFCCAEQLSGCCLCLLPPLVDF